MNIGLLVFHINTLCGLFVFLCLESVQKSLEAHSVFSDHKLHVPIKPSPKFQERISVSLWPTGDENKLLILYFSHRAIANIIFFHIAQSPQLFDRNAESDGMSWTKNRLEWVNLHAWTWHSHMWLYRWLCNSIVCAFNCVYFTGFFAVCNYFEKCN